MNEQNYIKLLEGALAIDATSAYDADALGFLSRAIVQASLPFQKPAGREYIRRNGTFTFGMQAGIDHELPYGSMPRLLLYWMCSQAVLTQDRHLVCGKSLTSFMGQLGLQATGGRWGTITTLKSQLLRLAAASVSCIDKSPKHDSYQDVTPISGRRLWWDPRNPGQDQFWDSTITLNYDFFQEIISYPVPIDLRAVALLKGSPLALDIYSWLTFRMSYLRRGTVIKWEDLALQFGSSNASLKSFKQKFLKQLKKVQEVYPAKVSNETKRGGLLLQPSKTHVLKLPKNQKLHKGTVTRIADKSTHNRIPKPVDKAVN